MSSIDSDRTDSDRLRDGFDNLSFAGCGFLGIYHVGVASCFKEYAPHLYAQRVSGASAGALAACALVTGSCLGECTTFTLKLALQARSRTLGPFSPSFHLVKSLRQALWNFLPDNAHEIASGRLFVSMTRVRDQKNVLVSQFCDKNDLIDALICSSFVPLYAGIIPPSYRGVRYVDGALSDNIPIWNKGTITVSPFAGESDICPNDQSCNLHHMSLTGSSFQFTAGNLYRLSVAFFPPSPEILSDMCRQGFDDALRFLQKNCLISCKQHLSIKSDIISSSPLEFELFDEDVPEDAERKDVDYSIIVNPASSDESDEERCCNECEQRGRLALQTSPPVSVVTALQAVCDEANKGFMAKIYKSRVYQVLSLLATPYVLPFEVAYQLVKKFYDWGPYMSEDMQWFMMGLYKLCLELFDSCESAIKGPSGWQFEHLTVSMDVSFGGQAKHRQNRKSSVHRKRSSTGRPAIGHSHVGHHHHHHHRSLSEEYPQEPGCGHQVAISNPKHAEHSSLDESDRNYSVNFGINISYVQSPVQLARSAREHMNEHDAVHRRKKSLAQDVDSKRPQQQSLADDGELQLVPSIATRGLEASNELYDTFDNCLNISRQMDSILAYYYLEEDDPTKVKVVEIFTVQPPTTQTTKQDDVDMH